MISGLMLGGAGLGAGLMYFLDASAGRRRRARARDKLVHAARVTRDAADTTARDLSHRARGTAAAVGSRLRAEQATDEVVLERVRAKLGRAVSHPRAIDVEVHDGRVILTGPVLAHEVKRLLAAVRRVRGVREIDNRLDVHKHRNNVPALQGGAARTGDRFELAQANWSPAARCLVGTMGGGLAVYGALRRGTAGAALGLVGLGLAARATSNRELRRLVGLRAGRRAVDIHKTINVEAPVEEVFEFWKRYENFPQVTSHVRDVRTTAAGRSHWTIEGPGGATVAFDALVTDFAENERIAWKTAPGSTVAHAGIVTFNQTPRGATQVDVQVAYNPPGGAVGHGLAALLGGDLKTLLDEDLLRMKTAIETGRPPHDAAQPPRQTGASVH